MLTHASLRRQVVTVAACWCLASSTWAREITFAWDPLEEAVSGYNFYYGPASRSYFETVWVGDQTMITIELPPGTYYFAVTAFDPTGQLESLYSNEVSLEWLNSADLSVSLTNDQLNTPPGTMTSYDVIVANLGPEDNSGAVLTEVFDSSFDTAGISWSCAPSGGARPDTDCPTAGTGSELSSGVAVSIEAGDAVSFTVQAPVLPAVTGALTSLASISAGTGPPDPDGTNNDDADIDSLTDDLCIDDIVILSNQTISSTEVYHACDTVRLGDNVRVAGSGLLVLRAGRQIVIQNGLSVESGARFIGAILAELRN